MNILGEACLIGNSRNEQILTMVDFLRAIKRECQKKGASFEQSFIPEELEEITAEKHEELIYAKDMNLIE